MSAILELTTKLRDTTAAIAQHEQALLVEPSPALEASLRSLQKRMERLEADFAAVAADRGVDVCRYRFFADYVRPTVNPVCHALVDFQSAFTHAFNAIKNGPQLISRVNVDIQELTTFGIGYSFSGSLGFALTFENKQMGLFDSVMDEAMATLFELAASKSTAEVAKHGKRLGASTIRAVFQWAGDHAKYGLGADIEWLRGGEVKTRLLMECHALSKLAEVLGSTSHTETETITVDGTLAGGEYLAKHAFHFVGDDEIDYRGKYTDAISAERPVRWPGRYTATIQKVTKVFYASDEEAKPSYLLLHLEPIE